MTPRRLSRRGALVCALFALIAAPANADPVLDLEKLDGPTAIKMMEDGELTSVQLTRAYIARIAALNKRGPALNAVTQLNQDALKDAALLDKERAEGHVRGPAHGLPILLKDLIDATGMYTSAGNYSLRNSFPGTDAGIVKKLREHGVVILGKLGLSEYANSFGNQPSGFSNLTGQVLHAFDADQNPSGSSSGSGTAGAAALATLTIGTETNGSIIGPSGAQSLVGIRPTVGLVPAYGIAPISASQDTAGPMTKTVAEAAMTLQSIAGHDPLSDAAYAEFFGPDIHAVLPPLPEPMPDYMSALDLDFVRGKRIGYNGTFAEGTPAAIAFKALEDAGAIMVPRAMIAVAPVPDLPGGYQQHKSIDEYYKRLGPNAPIKSLVDEVADNQANEHEALKFGNNAHLNASLADVSPGGANETAYRAAMPIRRAAQHKAINDMMNNETPADPSDDFIAILGSVPSGPVAGTPQITIPMGYNATQRRAVSVSIHGNAYSERNLIGVAYVIEQATKLRRPVSAINPSMYRCAKTVPAPPYASRGGCNPDYDTAIALAGGTVPTLPFSLETESVKSLQERMTAGTLTAETLTKAYLARIALTNAEGPATQAVRSLNTGAVAQARALDAERASSGPRGPLHGIPILLDDSIDVRGLATTGGSIALQHSRPADDAALVTKLRAAGAIVLGKTNVSELGGLFDANMPEGYSSLGGQVLLPSDTDKTPAGSSAGSAAATASGLAALAVGMETSTDTAQIIAPAGVAGVVALKPTVGTVPGEGVLPVAKSQDSLGPITRTVWDAATALEALGGPDVRSALTPGALAGKRVAVINTTTAPYPSVVSTLQSLGATTVVVTPGTPAPNPPSIVPREFERDIDAYLAGVPGAGAKSLADIVAYNSANPVEGLKYQQGQLVEAAAVDLSDPAAAAAYEADKTAGKTSSAAVLDALLADTDVIVVPSGNALVAVADRAGYPVLTVPAGYGTGGAGRNPIGVTFIAGAGRESALLASGYAFEQAANVRLAPSWTNPSMWRCVPGSTFFSPHHCHPGDLQSDTAQGPTETPVAVDVGGTVPATLALSVGGPISFGAFTPGLPKLYFASAAANVTSTGGDASLSVTDPSTTAPGRLVNGSYALPQAVKAKATSGGGSSTGDYAAVSGSALPLLSYGGPISNDAVTLSFQQPIGATDGLRTGTYRKTLVFTLSTTQP
jgi:amidase